MRRALEWHEELGARRHPQLRPVFDRDARRVADDRHPTADYGDGVQSPSVRVLVQTSGGTLSPTPRPYSGSRRRRKLRRSHLRSVVQIAARLLAADGGAVSEQHPSFDLRRRPDVDHQRRSMSIRGSGAVGRSWHVDTVSSVGAPSKSVRDGPRDRKPRHHEPRQEDRASRKYIRRDRLGRQEPPVVRAFLGDGAAPESNRASLGLPDLTGFEDPLGHRPPPLQAEGSYGARGLASRIREIADGEETTGGEMLVDRSIKGGLMELQELISGARDAVSVKRVYGDPYEKNGLTVIPAATVRGGGGGGMGDRGRRFRRRRRLRPDGAAFRRVDHRGRACNLEAGGRREPDRPRRSGDRAHRDPHDGPDPARPFTPRRSLRELVSYRPQLGQMRLRLPRAVH